MRLFRTRRLDNMLVQQPGGSKRKSPESKIGMIGYIPGFLAAVRCFVWHAGNRGSTLNKCSCTQYSEFDFFYWLFGSGIEKCRSSAKNSFRINRSEEPSTRAIARWAPTPLAEADEVKVAIFPRSGRFCVFLGALAHRRQTLKKNETYFSISRQDI